MKMELLGKGLVAFSTAAACATWLAACLAPIGMIQGAAIAGTVVLTPVMWPLASYILKGGAE